MLLQACLDESRVFPVERCEDLIEHFDQRDFESARDEILDHLDADETAADDHGSHPGSLRLVTGILVHAAVKGCTFLDPLADRPRIVHRPYLEDSRQIDPWQRRPDRSRTGRKHELVIRFGRDFTGLHIFQIDRLFRCIDRDSLAARPDIDGELVAKGRFTRHDQTRLLLDDATDMVWQPAIRIRNIRPPFDHDDLCVLVQTPQPRSAGSPTGHAADNHEFHIWLSVMVSKKVMLDVL